jgi:hypothetical protein
MFGDDHRDLAALPYEAHDGAPLTDGLVPVAFSFDRRRVRLLDLRGVDGREHTFRQTVERWVADHPPSIPFETDWPTFVEAALRTPLPPPTGFIFNVARCGSTLLANMLAAPGDHVVLKESSTVSMLLRQLLVDTTGAKRQELEALLAATVPLFGRIAASPVGSPSPRLFVKPHSLFTAAASTTTRLFPETPAIFLYRHPEEVVASMLANAPYGGLYHQPHDEIVDLFPVLATVSPDLTPAAFYAHLWRAPVEAALSLPPDRLQLVDYAELVSSPDGCIERLTRHLGLSLSPDAIARMSSVGGVYAKDAEGRVPFDATTHRRSPLSTAQRAEVAMVVDDAYGRLTARRRAQD